jgi:hypothetical protein
VTAEVGPRAARRAEPPRAARALKFAAARAEVWSVVKID